MYINPIIVSLLTNAFAYLDPGSGSFIIQLLVATLLGGMFLVKTYWKKIIGFFHKHPKNDSESVHSQDETGKNE